MIVHPMPYVGCAGQIRVEVEVEVLAIKPCGRVMQTANARYNDTLTGRTVVVGGRAGCRRGQTSGLETGTAATLTDRRWRSISAFAVSSLFPA